MTKPLVAIVGRPNVGKSTFFNRITGTKLAIVEDTPGVTRDRIYADAEWLGKEFTLIDTGGIDMNTEDILLRQMRAQVEIAIDSAEVILFFVDGKTGITSEDYEVAKMLRKSAKPVIVVVNKIDNPSDEQNVYDFYELGLGDVVGISSAQGLGLGDLLDDIVDGIGEWESHEEDDGSLKIALVGKPNVGKSSLTNKLLGHDRMIVSDIPGTTRDAIDSELIRNGQKYTIIDTAGMRKRGKIENRSIERYSVIRSLNAIRRADVVVVMVDATEGITEQDVKVAGFVDSEGKPCVIAVNKWDAIEKDTFTIEEYNKKISADLAFMPYAKRIYISATTGLRIDKLFDYLHDAYENNTKRIQTGVLNDCLQDAITAVEPPATNGRRLKVFYMTQVAVRPPTFVLFVNEVPLMHFSYQRYLENYLRKTFDFSGTPIKIIVRQRNEAKEEN
ncbi:MAG: ribosome biogenesis GTPase Der [Christensenella sp.]|nr:ribosome biogenesis GTPase Der [Christensenella sp.]